MYRFHVKHQKRALLNTGYKGSDISIAGVLAVGMKQHSENPRVQFHKLDALEKPKNREITDFGMFVDCP